MKIIVFGATGLVGKHLVQQALLNGDTVKAFGRNVFTELDTEAPNLELVKGALFDAADVLHAIKDVDAVVSAIGGAFDGVDKTRTLGIKNIIAQMQKAGLKRIIAIGGAGVLNADEQTLLVDTEQFPKELIPVSKEHEQAYLYLKESGLNWTFVCPPTIKDHEATGTFHTNANYLPEPNNYYINAGDLALFMLAELKRNEFVQARVGISN